MSYLSPPDQVTCNIRATAGPLYGYGRYTLGLNPLMAPACNTMAVGCTFDVCSYFCEEL